MRGWFSGRPEEEEHCAHASDNKSWLAVFGVVYNVIIHNVEFHLESRGAGSESAEVGTKIITCVHAI